jgi:hypothetical protein
MRRCFQSLLSGQTGLLSFVKNLSGFSKVTGLAA